MAIIDPLIGKRVRLRCAEASDAEFTLAIRNDPKLTEFIPKVEASLEDQRAWLKKQRDLKYDCFMIIENMNGMPKGTISFYDVDLENHICEIGRYISYGNALENVESVVLFLDYLYQKNEFEKIILNNNKENAKIISFWKKFGAEFNQELDMGSWKAAQYILTKTQYQLKRSKIISLLKRG